MNEQERKAIQEICDLFEKIDDLYYGLSDELKQKIVELHTSNATLPYCIRWGLNAASEIDLEF